MGGPIGSQRVNLFSLHNGCRGGSCPAFGHVSPISIFLFVSVHPQNFSGFLLEAMHPFPSHWLDQLHIKYKDPPTSHHRTGESSPHLMLPTNFQTLLAK